jgi:hypothetical protein
MSRRHNSLTSSGSILLYLKRDYLLKIQMSIEHVEKIQPFPWRTFSDEQLQASYSKLRHRLQKDKVKLPIPYSKMGLDCSDVFFQFARLNTPSQKKKSCVSMWYRNTDKAIKYHKTRYSKRNGDLFGTVVFMFRAPCHFAPYIAGILYKYFDAKSLAAMALNIDYIGIDSNPELDEPFQKLKDAYPHKSNIKFISGRCEDYLTDECDIVFTSPPFWNDKCMLEKYVNSETNYHRFLDNSLNPTLEYCFEKYRVTCLYINTKLYESIREKFKECDLIIIFNSPGPKNDDSNHIYCWYKK